MLKSIFSNILGRGASTTAQHPPAPPNPTPSPSTPRAAPAPAADPVALPPTATATATAAVPGKQALPFSLEASYDLGVTLGEGSFATVKVGVDKSTGKRVAVKMVNRDRLTIATEGDLHREIRIMRLLDHENIVKLLDFFEDAQHFHLVCEICEGGDLFDRIVTRHHYSEDVARNAVRAIFSAIDYCHDQGIVHRDLKPENLLLVSRNDDSRIKIADFGFGVEDLNDSITGIAGTYQYMGPEVILRRPYGKAADCWSLGVISFVLLGGYPPFQDQEIRKLLRKIVAGTFRFDPRYFGNVSDDAKHFISRLLALNPRQRMTAKQALQHPWLNIAPEVLQQNDLGENLTELRRFNASRKLRGSVLAVMAMNRMGGSFRNTISGDDFDESGAAATSASTSSSALVEPGSPMALSESGAINTSFDGSEELSPHSAASASSPIMLGRTRSLIRGEADLADQQDEKSAIQAARTEYDAVIAQIAQLKGSNESLLMELSSVQQELDRLRLRIVA